MGLEARGIGRKVAPTPGRLVAITNWTLNFSDPHLEQQFRVHQLQAWGCTKLWRLKMNLLAGVVNFSITIYMLSLVSQRLHTGCVKLGRISWANVGTPCALCTCSTHILVGNGCCPQGHWIYVQQVLELV